MIRKLIPSVTALLVCTALAGAAPILDGLISASEYDFTVDDTYVYGAANETGMDYYMTGLDIDYAAFYRDADNLNFGVLTRDDFMSLGSAGSYVSQTALNLAFYGDDPDLQAKPAPTPLWYINIIMYGDEVDQAVLVQNPTSGDRVTMDLLSGLVKTGSAYSFAPGITSLFDASGPDDGFEFWLDRDLFTVVDPDSAMYFSMQLDDLGAWADDQMKGLIPEPATLGLLGLGAIGLIRRRRIG